MHRVIFRRRSVAVLLVVAAALAASAVLASTATAMPPTTVHVTATGSATIAAGDLCGFAVQIDGTQTYNSTTFYDQNGAITKRIVQGSEQDTFTANGKTLVGDPYPFIFTHDFVDGVQVSYYGIGVAERVPLPSGGAYVVAGRINLISTPPAPILTVDTGNSGTNLDAFCAALS